MADIDTNTALIIAVIGAGSALLGGLISSGSNFLIEWQRSRNEEKKHQIQAHSNLLGCKHTILQYYKSYLISIINAEYSILHAKLIAIHRIDFTPVKDLLAQNRIEKANQFATNESKAMLEESFDLKEGLKERARTKT